MSASAITLADARANGRRDFAPVQLTKDQDTAWTETRTALLWSAPFFAHVFYAKCNLVFTEDTSIPVAATDGRSLIFRPSTFFKMPVKERLFVAVHEIAHVIWMHCELGYVWRKQGYVLSSTGKRIPYGAQEDGIMNQAMDYVINALLTKAKVGVRPKEGLYDASLSSDGTQAVVDVFVKLMDQPKMAGGGGSGTGKGGFDQHLDPGAVSGATPYEAVQQREQEQQSWANTLTQAAAAARAQGKMPANIDRIVGEIIQPAVDWRELVQAFFHRRVGSAGYSWLRPDRRLLARAEPMIAPGRSGHGCGTIVVGADTSGSIGNNEIAMFFGCLAGILEDLKPKRLVVMWCDAKVHRVDELEDTSELADLRKRGAPGGGGTSFVPVFDEIAAMGLAPDVLIYLTDMYGRFPKHAPDYAVLWAVIGDAKHALWGDLVKIPRGAA